MKTMNRRTIHLMISVSALLLFFGSLCQAQQEKEYRLEEITFADSIAYVRGQDTRVTGLVREYSPDGVLLSATTYEDGQKNGPAKAYYDSGALLMERNFEDGVVVGTVRVYYESGVLSREQHFEDGQLNGLERQYYPTGKLKRETVYRDGKPVSGYRYTVTGLKSEIDFK